MSPTVTGAADVSLKPGWSRPGRGRPWWPRSVKGTH